MRLVMLHQGCEQGTIFHLLFRAVSEARA